MPTELVITSKRTVYGGYFIGTKSERIATYTKVHTYTKFETLYKT